jgi:hypothetical protein
MRETAEPVSRAAADRERVGSTAEVTAPPAYGGVLALQRSAGNRATVAALRLARRTTNVLPFDEDIFRSKIGTEAARLGQMLFHAKLAAIVLPKAEEAAAKQPELAPLLKEWVKAVNRLNWKTADNARKALRELAPSGSMAALHGPEDARLEAGGLIFDKLWKAYADPQASFPDLTPYATLSQYQALRRWEMQACKVTAGHIAKRYIAAGGVGGKRDPSTAIKPTALVASVKEDMTPLAGDLFRGTVATYGKDLHKEVERMRRALDDGWVVHARVLSGLYGGGPSGAEAKHSILVYGYSGDTFDYFDPDVAGSNLARSGFDKLYFDRAANRLSTAQSEADFAVYEQTGPEGSNRYYGWQASGVHRYQVTSIETL